MLGGGKFLTQNKLLPGSYINFVSAKDASIALADRGYVAVALELDWGADGIIELTSESFQKDAKKLLGYDYADAEMKPVREMFKKTAEDGTLYLNNWYDVDCEDGLTYDNFVVKIKWDKNDLEDIRLECNELFCKINICCSG